MNLSEPVPHVECDELAQGLRSAVANTFRQLFASPRPLLPQKNREEVRADEAGISLAADGARRDLGWNDITSVKIEVNDRQPFGAEFWWVIEGSSGRLSWQRESQGANEVAEAMKSHLGGFNEHIVALAEEWRSDARFTCWDRRLNAKQKSAA